MNAVKLIAVIVIVGMAAAIAARSWDRSSGMLVPKESLVVWKGQATDDPAVAARAEVRFQLDNVGGQPVRILGVESGCGCAKPVVQPDLVPPGRHATVDVIALSIPVGKKIIPITIRTDSAINPDIELTLRLEGTRQPPFLYQLQGDLTFRGEYKPGLSGEIEVVTIEPKGCRESPELSTDLPFLSLKAAGVMDQLYSEPDIYLRTRRYRVEFAESPPSGTFAGTVIAKDPWMPGAVQSLTVQGQFRQSGLRATPSKVILDHCGRAGASILVVSDDPIDRLQFEVEGPSDIPLDVQQEEEGKPRRARKVTIRLEEPRSLKSGHAKVKIRRPDSQEEQVVRVNVVTE